jgi:UDP-N-acetylmuramoyl-L-alanyl-D-glutamate--2,6-diaminopimelate ligase
METPCPLILVKDSLGAMGLVSDAFYGHPSGEMAVIGVTGTNGKTTITYLLEKIFMTAGLNCGVIGTINYRLGNRLWPAARTTPLAPDLQRLLREMTNAGARSVVMEVSSHALALKRVDGINFRAGVFTNLTRDHLDFHKTMKEYFKAKARLFQLLREGKEPENKTAIINADDSWGSKLLTQARTRVLTYGMNPSCDLRAASVKLDTSGTHFEFHHRGRNLPVRMKLLGQHNVYNALAAIGAALAAGIDEAAAVAGVESLQGVPGRLEKIGNGKDPVVLVDYAHTEDALQRALETVRTFKPRRLIVVFGCGGDRDRGKRPPMGETAARLADRVIVTSDNPRSEDPRKIILDIEVGIRKVRTEGYEIYPDRAEAIHKAITGAGAGDVVLIAGKGHETTQIYADRTVPFDDREVARAVLQ